MSTLGPDPNGSCPFLDQAAKHQAKVHQDEGELQVIQQLGDWLLVENQELGQIFYNSVTGELSAQPPPEVLQKLMRASNKQRLSVSKSNLPPLPEVCEELLTPMMSPLAREQIQTLLLPGIVPEVHSARGTSKGKAGAGGDDLSSTQRPEGKAATAQMLLRACNAELKKGETQQRRLGRATHLKLNGLQLERLDDLGQHCPRLRVLYAFDNKIRSIDPLRERLETCYLQNNELREMASWSQMLPQLRVLNLSRNSIARVEGLEQCQALEELNLSYQKLMYSPSSQLMFSPQTLAGLCNLRSLDIAGNGLEDLAGLGVMTALTRLDASDNNLRDVVAVAPVLRSCTGLAWLRLEGNPLCRDTRYRDAVLHEAEGPLSEIDGKVVTDQQRSLCKLIERRRVQSGLGSARGALGSAGSAGGLSARGLPSLPKSARSSLAMAGGMAVMAS